jgi:NADH-quinone oxidoreductase subunit J
VIAQNIGFWIIALMMIGAALRVVTTNNVVHAALWLVVVLSGAAGQYMQQNLWRSPKCSYI